MPLQGTVAVLSGSPVIRTSRCLLGTIGIGDTIHIGSTQEFTVKNPLTCESLTLDRPWPLNAGLKGDTPISPDQIRWLYGGGITKYSTGIDKSSNGKLYNKKQGNGQDVNKNSTYNKELSNGRYSREGTLWVEFDCHNVAGDLCRAAFVESSDMARKQHVRFVIDIYSDKEKCCDTQDIRSCSTGSCRSDLNPIAHIHVKVEGKQIFYKVEDHHTNQTLRRRRLMLANGLGEAIS